MPDAPMLRDAERLAAVRALEILDTDPEPAFDDLARLAMDLTGASIGIVSFADDARMWFKAAHGLAVRESPHGENYCSVVVASGRPLVIADTSLDPNFATSRPATGPMAIRFYAGAPVRAPGGQIVGCVCAADSKPSAESEVVLAGAMESLARQVERLMELKRNVRALEVAAAARDEALRRLRIYREISEHAAVGLAMCDLEGRIYEQNPAHRSTTGYDDAALLGRTPAIYLGEETFERVVSALKVGDRFIYETPCRAADGREFPSEVAAYCIRDGSGAPTSLVMVLRDVTARRLAEMKLLASEELFRTAFEHAPIGMGLCGTDGAIQQANRSLCAFLGYEAEELVGLTGRDFAVADDYVEYRRLRDRLFKGAVDAFDMEMRFLRKEGACFWGLVKVSLVRDRDGARRQVLCQVQDLTPQKRYEQVLRDAKATLERRVRERTNELERANVELQEEAAERRRVEAALEESRDRLAHAERLQSVGRLAGGVAHEFNNLLAVIRGHVDLVRDGDSIAAADAIARAVDRASDLTNQLLAFGRAQRLAPRIVDWNRSVQTHCEMLVPLLGARHRLVLDLAPDLRHVRVDPAQLEQVLINLVTNARDASPGGGKITVRTRNLVRIGESGEAITDAALIVEDDGPGIPEASLPRIFDPFFTTKAVGEGTGLGLATVFGIVSQSGGQVEAESPSSGGARFTVRLPAAAGAPEPEHVAPRRAEPARSTDAATVLVVEDDPAIARLLGAFLIGDGHEVLAAQDGREALRHLEARQGDVRLMISDVVMPGWTGPETASRARALVPTLPVLFVSGYLSDRAALGLSSDARLLRKPFTRDAFLAEVRTMLASAPQA